MPNVVYRVICEGDIEFTSISYSQAINYYTTKKEKLKEQAKKESWYNQVDWDDPNDLFFYVEAAIVIYPENYDSF